MNGNSFRSIVGRMSLREAKQTGHNLREGTPTDMQGRCHKSRANHSPEASNPVHASDAHCRHRMHNNPNGKRMRRSEHPPNLCSVRRQLPRPGSGSSITFNGISDAFAMAGQDSIAGRLIQHPALRSRRMLSELTVSSHITPASTKYIPCGNWLEVWGHPIPVAAPSLRRLKTES